MIYVNSVVLVGRLTKDVEVRAVGQESISQASFTVAINNRGSKDDSTVFINCVAWRQAADFLGSYAKKGDIVSVEGRIQQRSYTTKDGAQRTVFEIVADNVSLISDNQRQNSNVPQQTAPKVEVKQAVKEEEVEDNSTNDEDDLPF